MAGSKKGTGDTPSTKRGRGRPPKPKPEEKKLATVKTAGRNQKHGLYCDPNKVKIDGRSFFGQLKRKIKGHFLECFKGEPSAMQQALADGLAANIIMAKAFQASFLRGDKLPPSIMRDYIGLWNSVSRDLATLSAMAKESGNGDKVPSLEAYLQAIKDGKLVPVEAEKVTPVEEQSGKRTLF